MVKILKSARGGIKIPVKVAAEFPGEKALDSDDTFTSEISVMQQDLKAHSLFMLKKMERIMQEFEQLRESDKENVLQDANQPCRDDIENLKQTIEKLEQ